jgi:glycosyltransferase involved in cell wall biosynthesis
VIRVLHLLTSTDLGGGPRQVLDLVRGLPRAEFAVSAAGPPGGRLVIDELGALGVDFTPLALDRLALRGLRATLRATARLVRERGAAIVHSHGKGAGLYGRLAARRAGAAAVHTFHGIHHEGYAWPARFAYLALERWLARRTRTLIHVSASQAREARALRLDGTRSVTIVNGLDLAAFDARTRLDRAALGLGGEAPVVGTVGRFDPIKRHELLIAALAGLPAAAPRALLVLVGQGPEETRLRAAVHARGLDGRVRFPGTVGLDANAYAAMDVFVAASRKEGLPLAPLEAMASRVPVVATDVPGHRDVVVHGETGLLVPASDARAFAEAVAALLADPARRRAMGEAGRARVEREFTVARMAEATAAVYRAAAGSG